MKKCCREWINACADIVDDALDDEADLDDSVRGHMKSMHIGAMDALRSVHERIVDLLKERKP